MTSFQKKQTKLHKTCCKYYNKPGHKMTYGGARTIMGYFFMMWKLKEMNE